MIDINRRRRPALYPAQTHSAGLNLNVGVVVLLVHPPGMTAKVLAKIADEARWA
ncbi:hypothetical protein C4K01_2274 [Pseudomonas synxantha]|nr:hypothetical protein C4K01_2274 [Pseudomonas synxantha]